MSRPEAAPHRLPATLTSAQVGFEPQPGGSSRSAAPLAIALTPSSHDSPRVFLQPRGNLLVEVGGDIDVADLLLHHLLDNCSNLLPTQLEAIFPRNGFGVGHDLSDAVLIQLLFDETDEAIGGKRVKLDTAGEQKFDLLVGRAVSFQVFSPSAFAPSIERGLGFQSVDISEPQTEVDNGGSAIAKCVAAGISAKRSENRESGLVEVVQNQHRDFAGCTSGRPTRGTP